jgi:hypothetical protein
MARVWLANQPNPIYVAILPIHNAMIISVMGGAMPMRLSLSPTSPQPKQSKAESIMQETSPEWQNLAYTAIFFIMDRSC